MKRNNILAQITNFFLINRQSWQAEPNIDPLKEPLLDKKCPVPPKVPNINRNQTVPRDIFSPKSSKKSRSNPII